MNITVDNLKKTFGDKTAVDIESLSISSGEMLGLVGNNGAGKTTFFRLLLDLIRADEGAVAYVADAAQDGLAINPAESEDWKDFTSAYIDEGFLIDFLTPEEFFEFVGKASGIDAATVGERLEAYRPFMADEILGQQKYIRNFSAGNKQKIGIIAALLNRPQILILDEPFNFLDPSSQNLLKRLLTDYNAQTGATVVVSSHNLQHTVDISSRVVLMEHGKVVKDLDNKDGGASLQLQTYFEV